MTTYSFEEKSQMRNHARALINDVREASVVEDIEMHKNYFVTLLEEMTRNDVTSQDEAQELRVLLGLADSTARERLANDALQR